MILYRFAANRFEVVDLFDFPVLRFGIKPGAFFVVFGAFASGLVFGGDSNPNADGLGWLFYV
jgi:hypothetical protein